MRSAISFSDQRGEVVGFEVEGKEGTESARVSITTERQA